jgi:hypothetical protein
MIWIICGVVLLVLLGLFAVATTPPLTGEQRIKLFESRFKSNSYIILDSISEYALADDVNFAISLGYKPVGSITFNNDRFFQSMQKVGS